MEFQNSIKDLKKNKVNITQDSVDISNYKYLKLQMKHINNKTTARF